MKVSRLAIMVFGIFVPIYILITFYFFNFQLAWLPYDWETTRFVQISVKYVAPILFCIAWGYWFILLGTRLANALSVMEQTSSLISAQYIIFYGVNAVVILIVFLIPVFTPIIAILSFTSMMFNLLTSRVNWDDLDASARRFVKVVSIITTIPVVYCSILVIPELIGFSIGLFQTFWATSITPLFYFIKALGIALSVGAIMMLYRRGITEVDRKQENFTVTSTPEVYFVESVIVVFMLLLNYWQIEFIDVLYVIGGVIVVVTFVLELVKGRSASGRLFHNPIGLVLFVIFFLSTFLFDKYAWLQYTLVIGSAVIFMVSYALVFIGHPDLDDVEKTN